MLSYKHKTILVSVLFCCLDVFMMVTGNIMPVVYSLLKTD
jgi:hypothetical protein